MLRHRIKGPSISLWSRLVWNVETKEQKLRASTHYEKLVSFHTIILINGKKKFNLFKEKENPKSKFERKRRSVWAHHRLIIRHKIETVIDFLWFEEQMINIWTNNTILQGHLKSRMKLWYNTWRSFRRFTSQVFWWSHETWN